LEHPVFKIISNDILILNFSFKSFI
jgi:hypothetical protein